MKNNDKRTEAERLAAILNITAKFKEAIPRIEATQETNEENI